MVMSKPNWSYIFGTATIVGVIGITVYAIKEYKNIVKQEEEAITADQAKFEVEQEEQREIGEGYDNGTIKGFHEPILEVSPEEYEFPQEITEEDMELKYEPNSEDARKQYINMELAEWVPGDEIYETLSYLFRFPFLSQNSGDDLLREKLIANREEFFGDSIWNIRVSYADLILYFGRVAEYHMDRDIDYWVGYMLDNIDISHMDVSSKTDDKLEELNDHTYYDEDSFTYGLFGLDEDDMDKVYVMANNNTPDGQITYEIEFEEYVKAWG